PRFFTEITGFHHALLGEGWFEARVVEKFFKYRFGDPVVDNMADEIHKLKRPHPKAANFFHGPVDSRYIGHAFFILADGFAVKGPRHAVDDESGRILSYNRCFAPAVNEGSGSLGGITCCCDTGYNLCQWHQRSGIKKVDTQKTFRLLQG